MEYYPYIVAALFSAFVFGLWKAGQVIMAMSARTRESESLSPADLAALKEACEYLIVDLRTAADECTAQVAGAIRKAELVQSKLAQTMPGAHQFELISDESEPVSSTISATPLAVESMEPVQSDPMLRIYQLADQGCPPAEIARLENRPIGEVKLILDLRKFQADQHPAT